MANIGSLSLQISANTAPLRQGMNEAKTSMKGFETAAKDAGEASHGAMLKTSLAAEKAVKGFSKLGDKIGLPTDEIGDMAGGLLLATKAAKALSTSLGAVKGALIASGIGLIAVAGGILASIFGGGKEEQEDPATRVNREVEALEALIKKNRELREAMLARAAVGEEVAEHLRRRAEADLPDIGAAFAEFRARRPEMAGVFDAMEAAARERFGEAAGAVAGREASGIARMMDELRDRAEGLPEIERRVRAVREAIDPRGEARGAAERLPGIIADPTVAAAAEARRLHAAGTFREMNERLEEQRRQLGMGTDAAAIFRAEMEGLGHVELEALAIQQDHNKVLAGAVAEMERMSRAGEALHDKLMTPLERFNKELADMEEQLFAEVIGLEDFQRGIAGVIDELERASRVSTPHGPSSAATAGSAAAIQALDAARAAEAPISETPQERAARILADIDRRARDEARKSDEALEIWRIVFAERV